MTRDIGAVVLCGGKSRRMGQAKVPSAAGARIGFAAVSFTNGPSAHGSSARPVAAAPTTKASTKKSDLVRRWRFGKGPNR